MSKNKHKRLQFYIFFVMMWVFYSLNARFLRIPHAHTVRWVVMAILILTVVFSNGGKISSPPRIVIAFIAAVVPSLVFSIDLQESMLKMLSFLVVVYGGYIFFSSLDSKEDFDRVLILMMIVIIVYEIGSILAMLFGKGYGSGGDRATGNTTNANTLGVYSNLAVLASFYWCSKSAGVKKLIWFILFGGAIWLCVLSGSRGGFASLILLLFFLGMFCAQNKVTRIVLIFLFILLLYTMFNGNLDFLNIQALDRLVKEGGTTRGELWNVGIAVWKQYPLFGCGYSVSNLHNTLMGYIEFHNSYLTILSEIGVWGVSVFGFAILNAFSKIISVLKIEMQKEKINLFLICCLMMLVQLVGAWSESSLFAVGSTEACTFWMFFTWCLAYRNWQRSQINRL